MEFLPGLSESPSFTAADTESYIASDSNPSESWGVSRGDSVDRSLGPGAEPTVEVRIIPFTLPVVTVCDFVTKCSQ
jgi:hypothetical protein